MATARQTRVIKRLVKNNGVLGRVAARYIEAGFRVKLDPGIEGLDIVAVKEGVKLGVKVLTNPKLVEGSVEKLKSSCEKHGFKPVLVLYGSVPKLNKEVLDKLVENGVIVKRVRTR